jgi:elongation factor 2
MWSTEFAGFEPLPTNMISEVVSGIRERKGLKKDLPQAQDFLSM